ncbi:hypothetical protein VTK26DRAFT_4369 [Humicola hyalothermophila]
MIVYSTITACQTNSGKHSDIFQFAPYEACSHLPWHYGPIYGRSACPALGVEGGHVHAGAQINDSQPASHTVDVTVARSATATSVRVRASVTVVPYAVDPGMVVVRVLVLVTRSVTVASW